LKRLIREGVLGRAVLFRNIFGGYLRLRGNHRADPAVSGGGCLIDHCCHSMDLFRFLVGDPTEVQAVAANVSQKVPIEDFGMIHLSRRGRSFGEITASYSLKVCRNWVEWYGTKGTALVSYGNPGEPDLQFRTDDGDRGRGPPFPRLRAAPAQARHHGRRRPEGEPHRRGGVRLGGARPARGGAPLSRCRRIGRRETMGMGIGAEFMRRTRHAYLGPSDQQRGAPPPPLFWEPPHVIETVKLPPPESCDLVTRGFDVLVRRRASLREYGPAALSQEQLSFLLWCTQGVRQVVRNYVALRTVPSAGARHALETFLLVNRVEGLDHGLYLYRPPEHSASCLSREAHLADALVAACLGQEFVKAAAVTFLWVAVPYRMTWRYGERGYRYLHLDAGHAAQNLYLAAEAVGAGACAVAAFDDDAANRLLGLDGERMFLIYAAAVGQKRP